jgi:hypothetical protein
MTSTLGSAFTTTMRMIDRIHRCSPDVGTSAEPTCAARFSNADRAMIRVAHFANGRSTP